MSKNLKQNHSQSDLQNDLSYKSKSGNRFNPQSHFSGFRLLLWGGALLILSLPLFAMLFTTEVNWTIGDFVVAGVLLFSVAGLMDLALSLTLNNSYRMAVAVLLASLFLLLWINGAVGIIGSENNSANQLYFAVVAVAAIGAMSVRFQAKGMSVVLKLMAVTQVLVTLVGLSLWPESSVLESPKDSYTSLVATSLLNLFFVLLHLTSARLFNRAAEQ